MNSTDVVVVGAGPTGSMLARELAQAVTRWCGPATFADQYQQTN